MRLLRALVPLLALIGWLNAVPAQAGFFVGISVATPPPPLPVYVQPPCPVAGYIWTPGYWAYDDAFNDYYWVPGTWVHGPTVGYLWTPGYWGWDQGLYVWRGGYWGPRVGFYGGINYGFGYIGEGYHGGYWNHDTFVYNTAVTNVNTTIIHNTYNKTVVVNKSAAKAVSYQGGPGGTTAHPTAEQKAAANEHHVPLTQQQTQHEHTAGANRDLRASVNHGSPAITATNHVALTGSQLMASHALLHGASHAKLVNHAALTHTPSDLAAHNNPALTAHNGRPLPLSRASGLSDAGRSHQVPRRYYSANVGYKTFHPHAPAASHAASSTGKKVLTDHPLR
jgi:hypothetical protein